MSATAGIEPQELADRLRADSMISDAEVMLGPEPERMTALIVSKGFRFGAELRGRAMHLLGEPGGRLQVAILLKIPRCPDGSLDKEQVAAIIRRPRVLFRFEPPGTENEKNLVELLRTLLPIQLISMSDSLGDLGADSITIIELSAIIAERFGKEIPPLEMFHMGSIRELAVQVFQAAEAVEASLPLQICPYSGAELLEPPVVLGSDAEELNGSGYLMAYVGKGVDDAVAPDVTRMAEAMRTPVSADAVAADVGHEAQSAVSLAEPDSELDGGVVPGELIRHRGAYQRAGSGDAAQQFGVEEAEIAGRPEAAVGRVGGSE